MNKFWNNFFLMNEAGADGADTGGGAPDVQTPSVDTPSVDTPDATQQPSTGLESKLFDGDDSDGDADGKSGGDDPEVKTDDYDAEKAYSEFKYNLPDGYSLSEEQQAQYIEMAKEKGIKPEQLQTFVDKHIEAQVAQQNEYRGIVKEWEQEVINDPEIGGQNFPETKKNVNNACSISGGAEFKKVLADVGLISNPSVVRYLNNLGKMINNDSILTGKQPKESPSADYKSLYTKSNY